MRQKLVSAPWLAELVALAGGVWAAVQLYAYAHLQESVLDEGAYVYKGWLFVSGQYTPYQPYGPWTNHMPLAFLLPGWFQALLGPGLRTARYVSVGWALLFLLGLWIVARRLGSRPSGGRSLGSVGGRWWGAAAVWLIALNPFLLKSYSTAVTQGQIAAMLAWTLVLTLGEDRPLWQIILGSLLAGVMGMTRINLLPVLPLLVLYLWWQAGRKPAIASALAGGAVVILFHALYWPDILQVWTRLPKALTPFLDPFRLPNSYKSSWKPDVSLDGRILSWFHSMRFQFTAMTGLLASLLCWPRKNRWKSPADFKMAVFLAVLFVVLLIAHLSQALGKDYCVFCLAGYVSFFGETGLLLLILTLPLWRTQLPIWAQVLALLAILVTATGIGYGAFEQIDQAVYDLNVPRWLIGDAGAGSVPLGAIITNKYALDAQTLRRLLPAAFGLLGGVGVLLLALGVWMWYQRSNPRPSNPADEAPPVAPLRPSYGYLALTIFLLLGTLFSASPVLAGGYSTYDCSQDVIAAHEAAGRRLAEAIPPGSSVYWKGPLSAAPLLYVPGIHIFPAQINDGYSHLEDSPDLDAVQRFGRWNETLARQWADQADFILIEQRSYRGWLRDLVTGGGFTALAPTPPTAACRDNAQILIFKRNP